MSQVLTHNDAIAKFISETRQLSDSIISGALSLEMKAFYMYEEITELSKR